MKPKSETRNNHVLPTEKPAMNRNTNLLGMIGSFAIVALSSGAANAALVIYEPFADNDSTLNGNSTGLGLSGTWSADAEPTIASPSLSWGSLSTSGNKVGSLGQARLSASTGTILNGLLDDGDTLWFSVIVRAGAISTNPDFAFALGTDALNDNSTAMSNSGTGLGFRIKGNNGGLNAATWTGGTVANSVDKQSLTAGNTYLFVGEMIFGASIDTINIYMPGTNLALGSVIATNSGDYTQTQFDTVSFGIRQAQTDNYQVDEIRFGTTYLSVVPVPEPSSAVLGSVSLACLILRRRRK